MRIEQVEVVPFRIPLKTTVAWANGAIANAEHVLVRVRDSDGRIGQAESTPRPMIYGETVASVLAAYRDFLGPLCVGKYPWELSKIEAGLLALVRNETARASLELACWDLYSKQLGVPAYRLLGGHTNSVRVSVLLGSGTIDQLIEEARGHGERFGISAFRVKVGMDLPSDVAACRAIRGALGDDVLISVDANHGYDGLQAREFARACQDLGLMWFEEPMPADHLLERERLVRERSIPILADESVTNAPDVAREVLAGRTDAISLKVTRTGILNSNRIRGFCEALGVPIVMGTQGESGIGTLAVAAYAASSALTSKYPMESGILLQLKDDLLSRSLTPVDGRIHLSNEPGWGIDVDADKLKQYRVST